MAVVMIWFNYKQSFAINVHDSGLSPPLAAFGHIIIDVDGTVTLEHPTTLSNHKVFLGHISFSIS